MVTCDLILEGYPIYLRIVIKRQGGRKSLRFLQVLYASNMVKLTVHARIGRLQQRSVIEKRYIVAFFHVNSRAYGFQTLRSVLKRHLTGRHTIVYYSSLPYRNKIMFIPRTKSYARIY